MRLKVIAKEDCMPISLFGAVFTIALIVPCSAMAYVGPGAGITLLGALWAVIVAFVFMVGGLLIWPLRALFRWRKNSRAKSPMENG